MAYHEIYPPEQPGFHPTAVTHNMLMDRIDLGEAKSIVEFLETSDAPMRAVQIRVLGGAMARVPADATAFAHRNARIMLNIAAFYQQPDEAAARQAWAEDLAGTLRQSDDGTYVGFLGDEGVERVRAAYPGATWDRLRAIKARYDPTNLFRLNQNIRPAFQTKSSRTP